MVTQTATPSCFISAPWSQHDATLTRVSEHRALSGRRGLLSLDEWPAVIEEPARPAIGALPPFGRTQTRLRPGADLLEHAITVGTDHAVSVAPG